MQTNVATQCEKGGLAITTPFALTTDYDGDTRNATPDIGADEFAGTSTDIIPPAINYTPFTQTSSFLPRTLTATITDGSGVPTSGTGLPVLYWKLNNGSYQAVQGVWTSGSTYTFTFGAANAYHDQVSYYIVALDMAATPNVGAMPWQGAAGYTSNPPTCSTPPTTPSSYLVIQNITGIKHIGVGKDYTTLTAAAADLNDKFMSGAVTFVLDDATYLSETFPILFNPNPGNSVTNTLIIKPNTGATPTISGSSVTNGLIIFNGLDYVTLDGSNSGGTERSLAIENTSCSFDAHVVGISNNSGTDPSTNITLKNCVMTGANNISVVTTYVIRFNYNGGTTGGGYDNCLITNNLIQKAQFGIQVTASTGKINHNLVISNNLIGTANAANYITHTGIDLEQTDNASITGNEIIGAVTGTDLQSIEGIVYFNNCTNTKITKNKIHDWFSLGNGAMGIKCDNNNPSTVTEISNNLIYNIKCYGMNPGTGQNLAYGIMVRSGGNIRMVYNSIYLSGPYLDGSDNTGPSSACIGFMEWSTNQYDIRNNILRNSMTNPNPGAAGSLGKAYAIMINVPDPGTTGPAMFSSLDYNDYYIDGYRGQIAQRYGTGGTSMTDYPNLASWQAYIGQDAHTLTSNPLFASDVDPMDLHVSSPYMNCGGIFATGFPSTDYAGTTRKNPPDIGAYEFAITISDYHTLPATNVAYTTATINGDMNTNGEVVETYIVYGNDVTYGSYGNPTGWGATPKVRTFTLTALNAPITGLTPNTTYHYQLLCYPSTSSQASFTGADMTFTTLALQVPTMVSLAATAVLPTTATINGTALANGVSTTVSFEYGLTTSYGSTVTATPATVTGGVVTSVLVNLTGLQPNSLYHFRAKGVNSVGTGYGSDLTFTTPSSITFNVDMSTASGFVPVTDLVYMAGSFPTAPWVAPGDAGSLLMSRVGSTLTYTLTMNLPAGSYEYKYFKNAGWNGGEYAGGSNRSTTVVSNAVINDQWGGQINWANVQWPGTGTIDLGGGYDVYAQAFIGNGVTYATGVAYGLQAWIGYSTSNTDPSTWTNWVAAPYFGQSGDNDEFKANLGAAIVTPGTYYYASRFQFGNMAYIYGGFSGGSWDGTSNVSGVLTVNAPATKTLNAKVFLEGLYNAESGLLVKTQGADADGNVWDMFTGTIADTVSVAIAETTSPFNTVYEVHGAAINTDGSIVISTIPASVTGDHYIIIRHRNSIETWSQAVSFTAQTISFDMTDDVAKAWGSNLKQVGSVYCIYTGDANGDQYIDGFDLALVFNQNIAGAYNYQPEDLNGDGFVDGFDLALVFNNNLSGAGMNTPINPMGLIRAIRK